MCAHGLNRGQVNHLITWHDTEALHPPNRRSERLDYRPAFERYATCIQRADTATQLAVGTIHRSYGTDRQPLERPFDGCDQFRRGYGCPEARQVRRVAGAALSLRLRHREGQSTRMPLED
jgi:hypothetical protein